MAFNRIVINEQDLTTAGYAQENNNVVFIPGLLGRFRGGASGTSYSALRYGKQNVVVFDKTDAYNEIEYITDKIDAPTFVIDGFDPTSTKKHYYYSTATKKLYEYGSGATSASTTTTTTSTPLMSTDTIILNANEDTIQGLVIGAVDESDDPVAGGGKIYYQLANGTKHYLKTTWGTNTLTVEDTITEGEATVFICGSTQGNGDNTYTVYFDAVSSTPCYLIVNSDGTLGGTTTEESAQQWGVTHTQMTAKLDGGIMTQLMYIPTADPAWGLYEYGWTHVEDTGDTAFTVYVAPENTPVLCDNLPTFFRYFGEAPYKFTSKDNLNIEALFTENAQTKIQSKNLYETGDFDISYIEAVELINAGIPVMYYAMVNRDQDVVNEQGTVTRQGTGEVKPVDIGSIYDEITSILSSTGDLTDIGSYKVKQITTGGFPILEYGKPASGEAKPAASEALTTYKRCLNFCVTRGDCYILGDPLNNQNRPLSKDDQTSLYKSLEQYAGNIQNAQYGTIFYPHYNYSCVVANDLVIKDGTYKTSAISSVIMPPSFAYLSCMAQAIKTDPDWLAMSGVARGQVPNLNWLNLNNKLTAAIADSYQERNAQININAITEVKPYGYCVWGNRTTYDNSDAGNLTASSFLNIRSLVSDVKKVTWTACQKCLFEQNTDVLWLNFNSMITPTLERMRTGGGITAYKILKVPTTEKAKLVAKIVLVPIYAVENVEVTVILTDDETTIS